MYPAIRGMAHRRFFYRFLIKSLNLFRILSLEIEGGISYGKIHFRNKGLNEDV